MTSSTHKTGTTSLVEYNGGVGYCQPSHYVKAETTVDAKGDTHLQRTKHLVEENVMFLKHKPSPRTCHRKLSMREKYLLIVCVLLFLSCIAFITIAFMRDNSYLQNCHCKDHVTLYKIKHIPQVSIRVHRQALSSVVTLVCNVSSLTSENVDTNSVFDLHYWWTLPNGENVTGSVLLLDNKYSVGIYTCFVDQKSDVDCAASNASIFIAQVSDPSQPLEVCLTTNCIQTAALLLDSMDSSVDPCDDFFQYACGNWNKNNFIPDDKTSYNTFEKLYDQLQLTLRVLLEDSPKEYDSNATRKAKILYQSCIDVEQIEIIGDSPLRHVLQQLGGWPVISGNWSPEAFVLEDVIGDMRGKYNSPVLIDVWIEPDDKNSSSNIIKIDEPSFGMPSREYFLQDEDSGDVKAYLKYMCDIAMLMGADPENVFSEMRNVLHFETMLANASTPQNAKHDTGARYRKVTIGHLQDSMPHFDWLRYFNRFLPEYVDRTEEIVVMSSEFLTEMVQLVHKTDKRVVSNFVLWRLVLGFIPELPNSFQEVKNEFRKVLQGIMHDKPRWNKCVEYLNDRLGMATGAMYVHDKFRKESKDVALEMISNLRAAFIDLLEHNDWMDNDTRAVARDKANAIKERIGYPDFILDPIALDKRHETLHFKPDQYFKNVLMIDQCEAIRTMSKFRKPVEKDEWEQEPAVVNAFYNPNTNDIVFPAGMLQPPFYSEYFPKSLNYGGIGVVIGHEITHGFDDKGRQYDKDGNIVQWWKNETIEAFQKRAECIVEQYSNVELEQIGKNIDGKNTQGENIADNGGLKQAYRAYKMWEQKHGPEPLLPGLNMTHDQLFFLNFAQIWCGNMRDKAALEKIRTSQHSPGPVRAQIPLANFDDFSQAFSCPLGRQMNPHHKCSVW